MLGVLWVYNSIYAYLRKRCDMKKQCAAFALVLCCVFSLSRPVAAQAEEAPVTYITDRQGLEAIAQNPAGSYSLEADIDMQGSPWQPIEFSGVLEGNGHSLLNLTIAQTDSITAPAVDGNSISYDTSYAALFSRGYGASINNLHVLGLDIALDTQGHTIAAGLIGYGEDISITNSSVQGRISLYTAGKMCGVGGLLGFGYGQITASKTDVMLMLADTKDEEKSEEFMGGIMATGYADISDCEVKLRAYTSVTGYVHNGGLVGMYFVHTADKGHKGYVRNSVVDAEIYFYENNKDRRAYCSPGVGEQMNWSMVIEGINPVHYINGETKDYSKILQPEQCAAPEYREEITQPDCTNFGYTTHTCTTCGYSFTDTYTLHQHQPGEWQLETAPDGTPIRVQYCTLCGGVVAQELYIATTGCVPSFERIVLQKGETAQLQAVVQPADATVQNVEYSTENPAVAIVSPEGIVEAVGEGTTRIVCTTAEGITAASTVTVPKTVSTWLVFGAFGVFIGLGGAMVYLLLRTGKRTKKRRRR